MANISIRVPDEIKKQASAVFSDLGLDMSTAINMFLRQSIKSNGLPFRPVNDPFFSDSNFRALEQSRQQLEEGKVIVKTMEELEAMENG